MKHNGPPPGGRRAAATAEAARILISQIRSWRIRPLRASPLQRLGSFALTVAHDVRRRAFQLEGPNGRTVPRGPVRPRAPVRAERARIPAYPRHAPAGTD